MQHGSYSPKEGYLVIYSAHKPPASDWWWNALWKLRAPPKDKLFMWCILRNKAPTGDNLQKQSYFGPTWCILCKQASESIEHLFLLCPISISLWHNVLANLHLPNRWHGANILEAWQSRWSAAHLTKIRNLHPLICWCIWLQRNKLIFTGTASLWPQAIAHLRSIYNSIPEDDCPHTTHNISAEIIDRNIPWAYFEGST